MSSTWPLWMVLIALGAGPALAWAISRDRMRRVRDDARANRAVRRALALLVLGLGAVAAPHAWDHAGLATVPAALVGLAMAHQIHRASGFGLLAGVIGVGLLCVHVLLDGSALAVHDEPTLPWLIAVHRLPVGIAIVAMASERFGVVRGRVVATVVVGLLGAVTALGYGLARKYVGEVSELVSGLTEAWVIGAMAHLVIDGLDSRPDYQPPGTHTSSPPPSDEAKAGRPST